MKTCPKCGESFECLERVCILFNDTKKVKCSGCNSEFNRISKGRRGFLFIISGIAVIVSNVISVQLLQILHSVILTHTICMGISALIILGSMKIVERGARYELSDKENKIEGKVIEFPKIIYKNQDKIVL